MPTTKRIICLANSRKLQGRCVAGIELAEQGVTRWIRPVSAREHQEVSEYERQYEDGSDPRLLDILEIPLLEHQPKEYQQENWLIDAHLYWQKIGKYEWNHLERFVENPDLSSADAESSLWQDGNSSYNGENDQIPISEAGREVSSLKLIKVKNLELNVFAPGEAFGNSKRRVRGRFLFLQRQYAFWITDPIIERIYLQKANGTYQIGECYLTISLGEPFNGFVYKLIAAVLEKPK